MATTKTSKTTARKTTKTQVAKTPARKAAAKKTPARKARAPKPLEPVSPIRDKMTKVQLADHLAYEAETDRKTVMHVLNALNKAAAGAVSKKGCGEFVIPGLLKITTRKVAARKGGKMVLNRFTGEMVKQKAKPATVRVKARPLAMVKRYAAGV